LAALTLIGRILLALIFVLSGLNKIPKYGFFEALMMAHKMPMTSVLLPLTIAVEVLGGLSVAAGYQARLGAALLIAFLIPATLIFHTGLVLPIMPGYAEIQQVNVLKNLSILGALMFILGNGPGPASVDARRLA
jgi:putative oxidoreductase